MKTMNLEIRNFRSVCELLNHPGKSGKIALVVAIIKPIVSVIFHVRLNHCIVEFYDVYSR